MDECGSSHDVEKHALNLHSSKEIDLSAAADSWNRRARRTARTDRYVVSDVTL